MLTIFALPKPFKGHFGLIQRNAISQWTRLRPRPEILLFGDEEGTAETAQEFGVRHVPEVMRNGYGTPLVSDLFEKVHVLASNDILCYVNADIMLLGNFMKAVQQVSAWRDRFLMVGRRTNVDLDEPSIYASREQETRLLALVIDQGRLAAPNAIDYFVFPRGLFPNFPQFAIGRPWWDNWFLWKARKSHAALVDASETVLAVHQNHGYVLPDGSLDIMQCSEAKQNLSLAGNAFRTIEDTTHKLTANEIEYNFRHFIPATKRVIRPWWRALKTISAPIRRPLGLRRETIASMLGRIRALANR
jgi:hypothetical protein